MDAGGPGGRSGPRLRVSVYQPPPPPPPPPPPEDPPPPEPDDEGVGADADETALEKELLKDEVKSVGEKLAIPAPAYHDGEYPEVECPEEPAGAVAIARTEENWLAQACSTSRARA